MLKNKFLATLSVFSILCGIANNTTVWAVDDSVSAENNKIYTLEELFEMSEDEFREVYEASGGHWEYFPTLLDHDGGMSGAMYATILKEDMNVKYTTNETENKLKKLIGDTTKYYINTPANADVDYIINEGLFDYPCTFTIQFTDYKLESGDITYKLRSEFERCWYCVSQVIPIKYLYTNLPIYGTSGDTMITGDVNLDRNVDLTDILYMTKANFNIYQFTDLQNKLADLNGDGKFTMADQCMLVNQVLGDVESAVQ